MEKQLREDILPKLFESISKHTSKKQPPDADHLVEYFEGIGLLIFKMLPNAVRHPICELEIVYLVALPGFVSQGRFASSIIEPEHGLEVVRERTSALDLY
jgi:hypothetical protein